MPLPLTRAPRVGVQWLRRVHTLTVAEIFASVADFTEGAEELRAELARA